MLLYQIPFSHNCIKVRVALRAKGISFEVFDISPMDRKTVVAATGQPFVPVLVDGETVVSDSTRILLWLEEKDPATALLPSDPKARVDCLMLEDWADESWMALSRRLAYYAVLEVPGRLEAMFFPGLDEARRRSFGERARQALIERFSLSDTRYQRDLEEASELAKVSNARLTTGHLVGESLTIADIALAAMCAPIAKVEDLEDDEEIRALLAWAIPILGEDGERYH
ncbi:MAG: glutathione S-transferase family protein [Planctomycetota bacterium]